MKPCATNRKRIAWLALGALETREAAELRDHLARCEGCRRYAEALSNVAEGLAAAAPDSNLEASERFHRRVAEKLEGVETGSILEGLAAWLGRCWPSWRVALPGFAVLVLALLAVIGARHYSTVFPPKQPQAGSPSGGGTDLAPTLANYQIVAGRSLAELDELLTRQGNQRLPPAPLYTASTLGEADGPF